MTQDPSAALSVALAYYHAWTAKDVDRAMTHVADDVLILDDVGGAQIDVRLSALSELWFHDPLPGAARARRSTVPASFEDCLEGLETTGREITKESTSDSPAKAKKKNDD